MTVAALDCRACAGDKTMSRAEPLRMSPIVVLIGRILLVPAVLGILFGLGLVVSVIIRPITIGMQLGPPGDAVSAAWTLAFAGLGIAIASLVGGLLGFLLVMRRKVWKCSACGCVLDRD